MYFAKNARYSIDYCTANTNVNNGLYCMVACRVLIGDVAQGKKNSDPPLKSDGHTRVETLVDDTNNPKIFVATRDYVALPVYYIWFNKVSSKAKTNASKATAAANKRLEKDAKQLYELYNWVYALDLAYRFPNDARYSQHKSTMRDEILYNTLESMLQFALKSKASDDEMKWNANYSKRCRDCCADYDSTNPQIRMKGDCNHSIICRQCFKQHLKRKIKGSKCTPWLQCPASGCDGNVHIDLIMQHCDTAVKYIMLLLLMLPFQCFCFLLF